MKKRLTIVVNFAKARKLIVGIVLAVILVLAFGVRPRVTAYVKGPAEKYETAKVKIQDLSQTVSASGEVMAENQVTLKFQTSGKLTWVGVKEGDQVKKWQPIASLDKEALKQNLKKDLNDYLNERWDFDQSQEDYITGNQPLDRLSVSDEIKRILGKAQFDLNNKVIDVEIADLAVRLATLISPIQGIVTNIEQPVAGINITPATAKFTIADPSVMKFVANVDEADIARLQVGQAVVVFLDAFPDDEFKGEVIKIAFAAVTTSGGGTAFPIEIFLPENPDQKFKVGMNGDTEVVIASKQDILTIPFDGLNEKSGEKWVEVIDGRKIKKVTIKTGLEGENRIEVTTGLKEGQIIITGEKKK